MPLIVPPNLLNTKKSKLPEIVLVWLLFLQMKLNITMKMPTEETKEQNYQQAVNMMSLTMAIELTATCLSFAISQLEADLFKY